MITNYGKHGYFGHIFLGEFSTSAIERLEKKRALWRKTWSVGRTVHRTKLQPVLTKHKLYLPATWQTGCSLVCPGPSVWTMSSSVRLTWNWVKQLSDWSWTYSPLHNRLLHDNWPPCEGQSNPHSCVKDHLVESAKRPKQSFPFHLDNRSFHLSVDRLHAKENGIIMFSFPHHWSHRLQPLGQNHLWVCKPWFLKQSQSITLLRLWQLSSGCFPTECSSQFSAMDQPYTRVWPQRFQASAPTTGH